MTLVNETILDVELPISSYLRDNVIWSLLDKHIPRTIYIPLLEVLEFTLRDSLKRELELNLRGLK